ncbi:hypothetical protein C5167_044655 [Papaver somniferum]|uniref:Uncharacterized protein n=1 Tax=Papaver somniferum TaxID=3469 RepID=A0A4Y7L9C5_PAPSO|nr:hypothetical protein C5167_044655 [Papaver somniferum]
MDLQLQPCIRFVLCSTWQDELVKAQEDIKGEKVVGVSDYSAPARAKVQEFKSKDGVVKHQLEDLCNKVGILIESLGSLCHTVMDIQDAMSGSVVASSNNGCLPGHAASPLQNNSVAPGHAQTPSPVQTP